MFFQNAWAAFCQALVLAGDSVGGVDQQQGDVGAVERTQRTHHRVVLRGIVDAAAAAHPGRVDEDDRAVGCVDERVDGFEARFERALPKRGLRDSVLQSHARRPEVIWRKW